jgi:hypothetical protein
MKRGASGALGALGALGAVLSLFAQEPPAAAREAYQPVLDNAWVRVERVHYAPNIKLPSHAHTEFAAAYVYLNASGPVVFRHSGVDYGAVTRAATKPGMFRLYRAVKEMHEVENTTAQPSDFFRIEFKTEPLEAALLRGRFERVAFQGGEPERVQFENAMLRVTRIAVADGKAFTEKNAPYPTLFVHTRTGVVRWVAKDEYYGFEHEGDPANDLLRFELKTAPQSSF